MLQLEEESAGELVEQSATVYLYERDTIFLDTRIGDSLEQHR